VVATGFAQLWAAKQEAARLKKEEESASFKFRERTVEMKTEEEIAEQDFAATFVDFTPDFADLEVRREGDNSDNVELHQAREAVAQRQEQQEESLEAREAVAQRQEQQEEAAAARRENAASSISEDDLVALFHAADHASRAVRTEERALLAAQRRLQQAAQRRLQKAAQ
ncbi:hypothetical protein T484DRAFT_1865810, partial [Baffinella frigidus]